MLSERSQTSEGCILHESPRLTYWEMQATGREGGSMFARAVQCEGINYPGTEGTLGDENVLCVDSLVVTQLYTLVKSHQAKHLKNGEFYSL